ncbi:MAG: bifunctional phosphopantothenoylcysteine decarboxylase/phosphopantothenate--cysteine ligase CoaBC [Rickettsiales bacterium]|nr:bifunctional phosphopantothenoylcysteine decarboxylase/phosphopantothenate--cysteine ligase CoaBC [Rickettsiales bacterium]
MNILLIITGSIAAVKTPELVRELKKQGHNITCVLTKSAEYFVTKTSLAYLSENIVYQEMFEANSSHNNENEVLEMAHISLSRKNDIILVAPATADFIAKLANGFCDDLASTICVACDKKIFLAPAMNTKMLEYPATQENLSKLKKWGFEIIEPISGVLACGEEGAGKMAEINYIISKITAQKKTLKNSKFKGKRILVTAGATIEEIDPVRFISNYSSGKQGYFIAEALQKRGAEVTLISGEAKISPPKNINFIKVKSADEMLSACKNSLPCDIAIFASAVADWKISQKNSQKIKKENLNELNLKFVKTPDILKEIANLKRNRPEIVIGFCAESENLTQNAKQKLKSKNCDIIIANQIMQNGKSVFGSDYNSVQIFNKNDKMQEINNKSKLEIAENIADYLEKII